jgi:hypothetical protein
LGFNIFSDILGAYINLRYLKDMTPSDIREAFGIESITDKDNINKIINDNTKFVEDQEELQKELNEKRRKRKMERILKIKEREEELTRKEKKNS